MRRRRREVEVVGLSFLDAICCGFGAIVLLLVIAKVHDPILAEEQRSDLTSLIVRLGAQILSIADESLSLEAEVSLAEQQRRQDAETIEQLQVELAQLLDEDHASRERERILERLRADAEAARERLLSEVERARSYQRSAQDKTVGGIPADSDHVIFVIDTSGSMQAFNWGRVVQKVEETLLAYPQIEALQIMNDMGDYMFSQTAGRWLDDSPSNRQRILRGLAGWRAVSNSSPVEGIERAIETYHAWDKQISIYVFGDEFSTGSSIQRVVDEVDRLNRPDARGRRPVRIHAIGFTVETDNPGFQLTNRRFSTLMRELCHRNGGSFVGLEPAIDRGQMRRPVLRIPPIGRLAPRGS